MALVRLRTDRVGSGTGPPAPPLPLPTGLAVTAGDGQATLTWTAPSPATDVTDYRVQYRTSPAGSWTTFADAVTTTTGATVTGLTNGTTYDFQVAAIRTADVGAYIGPVTATPAALPGPTALQATAGNGNVALSWTAPSPATGVTDYAIQYRVSPAGVWETFPHTPSTATSRTVTGLANGTAYNFQVAAVRSGTIGDYTAGPVTATPKAPVTPPPTGDIYDEHVGFGNPGLTNPVSIVVTSDADSGPGTLRSAIAGNGHKHITFASNMTITVTSGLLRPGSNTLIDARGKTVTIQGTLTMGGFILENVFNVSFVNLRLGNFGNPALTSSDDPWDAILCYGSRDVWLHHCELFNASDKLLGMQRGTGAVTVSWCHFRNQVQVMQSGSDSGGEAVDGVTRLTVHHTYWDGTGYRHPVMSYGWAHIYNNYYRDWDNYGARCQRVGRMYFERNTLYGVRDPKATLNTGTGGADKDTRPGSITHVANVTLPGSVTLQFAPNAPISDTFNPADYYAYTPQAAGQALADAIVAGAGATL